MARQQVNVRLPAFTIGQLKDLASRFDMSESAVIMLAIDRLERDTQDGKEDKESLPNGEAAGEGQLKKGGQNDGNDQATRTRRRYDHKATRRKVGVQD